MMRQNYNLNKLSILKFTLVLMGIFNSLAVTQAKNLKMIRQGEKISLSLSGDVMTDDERKSLFNGSLSLSQLIDIKLSSSGFNRKFAEYWARKLGITVSLDAYELRTARNRSVYQQTRGKSAPRIFNNRNYDEESLQRQYDESFESNKPVELSSRECNGVTSLYFVGWRYRQSEIDEAVKTGQWGKFGSKSQSFLNILQKGVAKSKLFAVPCESDQWIEDVKPWFDPKGRYKYRVNKNLFQFCGNNLEKCHYARSNYRNDASYEMTMEPAYLISRIVMDDRTFSDVLTTKQTVIGSSYGHFLANIGTELNIWDKFPGGAYADITAENFEALQGKFHLIERTKEHSGILTTPTYQILANGRRAKANKAYEVMLCREFKVPEGILPDPTDDNEDLRKRAYCAQCHRSLEPMAAFFNRYPKTADTTIYSFESGEVDDRGVFAGKTGSGVADFGAIMAKTDAFRECSVRRAYEFIHNRAMDIKDKLSTLPKYEKELESNGLRVKRILKQMLLSDEFLNSSSEEL